VLQPEGHTHCTVICPIALFAWCARLSRLIVGLRTHLNLCTVSYRIVSTPRYFLVPLHYASLSHSCVLGLYRSVLRSSPAATQQCSPLPVSRCNSPHPSRHHHAGALLSGQYYASSLRRVSLSTSNSFVAAPKWSANSI